MNEEKNPQPSNVSARKFLFSIFTNLSIFKSCLGSELTVNFTFS